MIGQQKLIVGTFNVRGLKTKEHSVTEWIRVQNIAVAALTETWITPGDDIDESITEYTAMETTIRNGKGYGGVALCIHPLLKYSLLAKKSCPQYQYIAVKAAGIIIVGLYISPSAPVGVAQTCLAEILSVTGQMVIIAGDLNGKNTDWNTTSNTRGILLKRWALQHKWKINAPSAPTFIPPPSTGHSPSTIDIMLIKGLESERTEVDHGIWDGCSDHLPISAVFRKSWRANETQAVDTVSHARRQNAKILTKAKEFYGETMPALKQEIQCCQLPRDIDTVLQKLASTILHPWSKKRQWQPRHTSAAWSKVLQNMAKKRAKSYRKALKADSHTSWKTYREIDKRIKRGAKRLREQRQASIIEKLSQSTANEATKRLAQISRERKRRALAGTMQGQPLDMKQFARHVATPDGEGYTPTLHAFEVNVPFHKALVAAIKSAPNGKSVGTDSVFVEAMKEEPEVFAEIIASIWRQCGKLKYMPEVWRQARLVPIHKKGDTRDPQNYRPISIISQIRKVIDRAIDTLLREEYTSHPSQVGFRQGLGTENAIIRSTRLRRLGMQYTAVLDLKKAYDSVPRDRLMNIVRQRLSQNHANMIAYLLQPMELVTDGPMLCKNSNEVTLGVPQGDPASTTLFNMYMDVYAETVLQTTEDYEIDGKGLIMFADDVNLQARTPQKLQEMLNDSTEWAKRNGMQWSTHKCYILQPGIRRTPQFKLAEKNIQTAAEVQYLGITMTSAGVVDSTTIRRCLSAQLQLRDLCKLGLSQGAMTALRRLQLCQALVMPLAEYAMHLTPHTEKSCKRYEQLQAAIMKVSIGNISATNECRARKLTRLAPHAYRAASLCDKLKQRLDKNVKNTEKHSRDRRMAVNDQIALEMHRTMHELPPQCKPNALAEMWLAMCNGVVRRIPSTKNAKRAPILAICSHRHRNWGIAWYFNRFPPQNAATRTQTHRKCRESSQYVEALGILRRNMPLPEWDSTTKQETVLALECIANMDIISIEASGREGGTTENGRAKMLGI